MKDKLLHPHFVQQKDLPLIPMAHTFTEGSIWLAKGMAQQVATFDLTIRKFNRRNYMLFCGLEEILNYLSNLSFSESDVKYLMKLGIISQEFARYLRKFGFGGTVYAMEEGTPFFPGEPMVRVTAPIIDAALVEAALINIAASNVPFLTKAVRSVLASQGKFSMATGPLRSHSFESGMKASRAAYLAGMSVAVTPLVPKKYQMKIRRRPHTTTQHFFIKSFPSEIEAMEAAAQFAPDSASFMVDTYDTEQGIKNAIKVAKKLAKEKHRLYSIFIDSGDIAHWARYARKELDKNKLDYVKIFVATNMDEYKIDRLAKENVPCDNVALATEYMTLSDSPKLEVVYKVAELRDRDKITYVAKLAAGKMSLPGRKQVFRVYRKGGKLEKDIIGLEEEALGEPLLKKMMERGKLVYKQPSLDEIKDYLKEQVKKIPARMLELDKDYPYQVKISDRVNELLQQVKKTHLKHLR